MFLFYINSYSLSILDDLSRASMVKNHHVNHQLTLIFTTRRPILHVPNFESESITTTTVHNFPIFQVYHEVHLSRYLNTVYTNWPLHFVVCRSKSRRKFPRCAAQAVAKVSSDFHKSAPSLVPLPNIHNFLVFPFSPVIIHLG